jgi:hypothetical protein
MFNEWSKRVAKVGLRDLLARLALTAAVGRFGCMTSTMVAPQQPGSPQSCSLTLTAVSSSAPMTVRACASSLAPFCRSDAACLNNSAIGRAPFPSPT